MCSSFHAEMESEGKYFNMSPYDYKRQMREKLKPLAHGMTLSLYKQLLLTRTLTNAYLYY